MKGLFFVLLLALSQSLFAQHNCPGSGSGQLDSDFSVLDIPSTFDDVNPNISSEILASGWSGAGGDDDHNKADNIWYLGSKPIYYCIRKGDDFSFSKRELSQMVKDAINEWRSFFKKYQLDTALIDKNHRAVSIKFLDGKTRGMSLNFRELSCEELKVVAKGEELVFQFGGKNAVIDTYKDLSYENALGMAIRKGYNYQTYRNSGFVYIAPFSREQKRVYHMLLHELGHVFGMKHDSVFVMAEDAAEWSANEDVDSTKLGQIESKSWPYYLKDGATAVLTEGLPGKERRVCPNGYRSNARIPRKIMRRLGFRPTGCHRVVLKVDDLLGPKRFKLDFQIENRSGVVRRMTGVFKSERKRPMHSISPGVYGPYKIKWGNQGRPKTIWARAVLDNVFQFPARGHIRGGAFSVGSRIDMNQGLSLELFFPQTNNWWVVD